MGASALDQHSLTIVLHLKSELLTLKNHNTYVTGSGRLSNFGPFQRPPLGFFSQGGANNHALPITMLKSREVQILMRFLLTLHCRYANATQVSLCKSNE